MIIGAARVTVSGSFRKAMTEVAQAVDQFQTLGCAVLSPADPRVVDAFGEFLFVASDRLRNIRMVQQRHLAAIQASDLLWIVAPHGYVGSSTAMEIGFAAAVGTPVFSADVPSDLTLRQWVEVVASPAEALARSSRPTAAAGVGALLDPVGATEQAHRHLEVVTRDLLDTSGDRQGRAAAHSAREVVRLLDGVV